MDVEAVVPPVPQVVEREDQSEGLALQVEWAE